MNSCPNSDSKRCPESKLGHVHSVHTLGPGCTHATRTLRRVAGLALPCRRLGPAVPLRPRTHWHAVSQAVCCTPCRASYRRAGRHVAHRIVAQGAMSRAYSAVSWPSRRRIMAPPPAVPRLSRDTTRQPSPSRCCRPYLERVGHVVACLDLYRGRPSMHLPVVSWPGAPAVSRYNALYRDSGWKKMGSSPFQLLHFFFPFDLLEDYQKKKKLHFAVEPKIFFLNIFFPVLHTVKPRKIFLNTHFFPFNS